MAANPDIQPTAETPPTFIVQAEDDPVHVENATNYFLQLKKAKVPAELHIYAEGGHGYGLRRTELPVTAWPVLVETWLRTIKMLNTQTATTDAAMSAGDRIERMLLAVITISDRCSRGEMTDTAGPAVVGLVGAEWPGARDSSGAAAR